MTMNVYFATMTGNAESLATSVVDEFVASGLEASLVDMGKVSPSDLTKTECAVFIVSTWGEGEPPNDADEFWSELEFAALDLSCMHYAVFGLGDSGYDEFNGFARDLDERLKVLGAKPFMDRVDADIDYSDDFDDWEARVLKHAGAAMGADLSAAMGADLTAEMS